MIGHDSHFTFETSRLTHSQLLCTVYPKKYAHSFVVFCFVVVMQSFIMNSHEVFIHIHQGCFAGTGAIVRLPQCQWSKPDGYGKISQCITTTKHSKAKTVCIFLGIYCIYSISQICLLFCFDIVSCGYGISCLLMWIASMIQVVLLSSADEVFPKDVVIQLLYSIVAMITNAWPTKPSTKYSATTTCASIPTWIIQPCDIVQAHIECCFQWSIREAINHFLS